MMNKPRCYNRPPFKPYVAAPIGWTDDGRRDMTYIPDEMSKTCHQHGPMGEATLHPERWDCAGCEWKPTEEETK